MSFAFAHFHNFQVDFPFLIFKNKQDETAKTASLKVNNIYTDSGGIGHEF